MSNSEPSSTDSAIEANAIAAEHAAIARRSYRVSWIALIVAFASGILSSTVSHYDVGRQLEVAKSQFADQIETANKQLSVDIAGVKVAQDENERDLATAASRVHLVLPPHVDDETGEWSYVLVNGNVQSISNVWYEYESNDQPANLHVRVGALEGCKRIRLAGPRGIDHPKFRLTVLHFTDPSSHRWKWDLKGGLARDRDPYVIKDISAQFGIPEDEPGCESQ